MTFRTRAERIRGRIAREVGRARAWPRRSVEEREASVARYFHDYRDRSGGALLHLLGRPVRTLGALVDLLRLPVLTAYTHPDTVEGAVLDRALAQRHTLRRFLPHASVLVLPDEPEAYSSGPNKQTVRRMVRKAQKAGIVWRRVDDPAEQANLIRAADEWERVTPQLLYRDTQASNEVCLDYRLWLAAFSRDDRLIALSVTPVDGEWALLRYFRTIGVGTEQSLARYYLLQVLVEHLVRAGVGYLFDETPPVKLSNGLRHYQHMVGFRLYRVRVASHSDYPWCQPRHVARRNGSLLLTESHGGVGVDGSCRTAASAGSAHRSPP